MIGLMPFAGPNVNFGANAFTTAASTSDLQIGDIAFAIQTGTRGAIPALTSGWTSILAQNASVTGQNSNGNNVTRSCQMRLSCIKVVAETIGQSISALAGLWKVRNNPDFRPLDLTTITSPASTAGLLRPISAVHGRCQQSNPAAPTVNSASPSDSVTITVSDFNISNPFLSVSLTGRFSFWPGDFVGQTLTLSTESNNSLVVIHGD